MPGLSAMQNALNRLILYNGYPLSVVLALALHTLLLVVVMYLQSAAVADDRELVQPTIIKALFIEENPQLLNRQRLEWQRTEQRRLAEMARQQQQQQAEAQRQAQQARERAERAEQQRAEQAEAQRQARLRQLAEQQALERQQAEQLRQQQQEQREREQEQQRQRQAEQEQRQRAAAEAAAAVAAARNEFELVQSATGLIQQVVQENWSRPPSARNGMRAVLQIRMLPTGELLEVAVIRSSGDPAFDRSAETAVYRAAPFTELQSLPISVFNTNFRSLSLIFEPADLLN